MKKIILSVAAVVTLCGCSTTQDAQFKAAQSKLAATLSTPQTKSLESDASLIAQAALSAAVPGGAAYAWTIPVALNFASGMINSQTTDQAVATIQSTVAGVAAAPEGAYAPIAKQVAAAFSVIHPTTPAQQTAAAQYLANAVSAEITKQVAKK